VLEEMSEEVAALSAHVGRPLTLIAESDLNDPRMIRPREAHGFGIDAQWSDDFHHAVHVNLTRETTGYYEDFDSIEALATVLQDGFFHARSLSSFRGRVHGRPIDHERTPTWRLVTFAQDHDQIGNRATGDRLTATLDENHLALAALITLTAPSTPMLFMGEEWAASTPWQFFTSHPEKELGEATAKGRIEEFAKMGWDPAVVPDPQDPETFTRSKLDWAELDGSDTRHTRMLRLYRRLIELRRTRPELTDPRFGSVDVEFDEQARWLIVHRSGLDIVLNLSDSPVRLPVRGAILLATDPGADLGADLSEGLELAGASGAIVDTRI
jgi:maltooligosyltrehalose trehalohydrolase